MLAGARAALIRLGHSLALAAEERAAATPGGGGPHRGAAAGSGPEAASSRTELERLTDSVHRDEVARAEQRLRIEALETRAVEELGVDPEVLLAEYGPDQLVPPTPAVPAAADSEVADEPPAPPAAAAALRPRGAGEAAADGRACARRCSARSTRWRSRSSPRSRSGTSSSPSSSRTSKKTRRDLLDIIREVDERVEQVFTAAYDDTAREFEGVFARLFPGGEGRLVLTDPSDMLTTGIEVEARPPGKKVKRLSLLSGGERSLTAVALLVAIFKARPSPFYVMDEVEAALDDTNLGRLLTILEELRESSQLIVITHQKRTMEIADALYGVSMRGDGVTEAISQRLREPEPA